jgi:hypothetical protein
MSNIYSQRSKTWTVFNYSPVQGCSTPHAPGVSFSVQVVLNCFTIRFTIININTCPAEILVKHLFLVLPIIYFSQLNLKTCFTIPEWSSYCCLYREMDPGVWNSKVFNQLKTCCVFSHTCCIYNLQTSKNMIHINRFQTKSFHLRTVKPCQMKQFYIPCTEKFTLRAWPAGAWRYSRLKTSHLYAQSVVYICIAYMVHAYSILNRCLWVHICTACNKFLKKLKAPCQTLCGTGVVVVKLFISGIFFFCGIQYSTYFITIVITIMNSCSGRDQ